MIIVTGASKGLGKAICERLISKHIKVLGLARDIRNIEFNSMKCDVSNYDEIKFVAQRIKELNFGINGLINVAGISSMGLAIMMSQKTTQNIINTNLLGTIYCSQVFTPLIIRNKNGGSIINFSSIAVPISLKGEAIYAASKAGIESFTKTFAREMTDFSINVNCISPGPIDTDLLRGVSSESIKSIVSHQIIQKQFLPSDICDLVELLLNPQAKSLSGQIFHVGGV